MNDRIELESILSVATKKKNKQNTHTKNSSAVKYDVSLLQWMFIENTANNSGMLLKLE